MALCFTRISGTHLFQTVNYYLFVVLVYQALLAHHGHFQDYLRLIQMSNQDVWLYMIDMSAATVVQRSANLTEVSCNHL